MESGSKTEYQWRRNGDDGDVAVGGVSVVVGAADVNVGPLDGLSLLQVERLALRHAFDDVDEPHIASSLAMIQCAAVEPRCRRQQWLSFRAFHFSVWGWSC